MAPGQINPKIYRTRHALHFYTLQECISKHSNAQIKECNSNIAPTTRHSSQCAQDLQPQQRGTVPSRIYTTDQGIQIKACIFKHEKYSSPNTQMDNSRNAMQLQTSPQQLGTVPSRIYMTDQGIQIMACISKNEKYASPNTQMHRSRIATPNI